MIGGARTIVSVFSFGYALLSISSENIEEVGAGAGIGAISLLAGHYLKKETKRKSKKPLKILKRKLKTGKLMII